MHTTIHILTHNNGGMSRQQQGFKRKSAYNEDEIYMQQKKGSLPLLPLIAEQDDYNDPRFVSLRMDLVRGHIHLYEKDSDIQTFARACLNYALAGGILFERKGRHLDAISKDWHNAKWSQWVRDVEKSMFCLGFALVSYIPHEKYGGMPTVISLEHVEIRYCLDIHLIPHFRVYEILDTTDSMFGASNLDTPFYVPFGRRRIPNVKVFSLSPPTKSGAIRSAITTLMADLVYENHLLQAALIADQARARPPLVTQRISDAYNSAKATGETISTYNPHLGNGTDPHRGTRHASDVVQFMNAFSGDSQEQIASRVDRMLKTRVNNSAMEQVYVEDGRQVVNQVMPEAPHAIILGFRQSRMVRVAMMFGITLPALTAQAKTGTGGSDVKKAGAKGKDEDGSNSMYFENFQRELKQRFVGYIREMYMYIHTIPFSLEAANDKSHTSSIEQQVDVTVSFPGQPDDAILTRLFTSGCMKYDYYISYLSTKHAIPIEAFETTPKMTVKEMNGILPPPPVKPTKK